MSKKIRHQRILDLVASGTVTSQEHLRELLEADGFSVTQSTLSRDIKDLELVKGRGGYQLPVEPTAEVDTVRELTTALSHYLLRCTPAQNLVVLKTAAGNAQALAVAIDRADLPGVVGTLGGDDTVLLVSESTDHARQVAERLLQLAKET